VQDYHHKMLADWREHKRARDEGADKG
jgi:hypothetical protein